jgi:hypothetical protein
MVRACLPLIPGRNLELGSMFMQMNMEMRGRDSSERRVSLCILVYPDVHVTADATVRTADGYIQIQLPPKNIVGRDEPTWSFQCRVDPQTGKMVAQLDGQRP